MVPKRPRSMNHCKTTVKVPVARIFCTCVRAKNVFRKRFSKKRYESRQCAKYNVLGPHFDFRLGFAIGFECNTKPQREFQSNLSSPECVVSVGVYTSFRKMHTKSIIKLQTFGPEGAKGRSNRERPILLAFLHVLTFFAIQNGKRQRVLGSHFGATWSILCSIFGAHWILKCSPNQSFFTKNKSK